MSLFQSSPRPLRLQRGVTLIELMVSVTIGLLVVAGAGAIYLYASQTQRVLTERQNMFEGAKVALDIIGRDLENAGYYPAENSPALSPTTVKVVGYGNPCDNPRHDTVSLCDFANPGAFNTPVFGCSGQRLVRSGSGSSVTYACGALSGVAAANVDSLVVNYFTNDAESLTTGQRADCQGQDVVRDAINSRNGVTPTAGATAADPPTNPNRLTYSLDYSTYNTPTQKVNPSNISKRNASSDTQGGTSIPALPLFVSNRYTLVPVNGSISTDARKEMIDGQLVTTFSMACDGNGNDNDANAALASVAQPMVSGLEQLKFQYLINGQYRNAPILGAPDWSLVTAVRVCILAHTYRSAQAAVIKDCNGNDTPDDGRLRKVFTQVFALKNALM
ncbi:PilW family protein [Hydrogenophaga soli]